MRLCANGRVRAMAGSHTHHKESDEKPSIGERWTLPYPPTTPLVVDKGAEASLATTRISNRLLGE